MSDLRRGLVGPAALVVGGVLRLLSNTYRVDTVLGQEHLATLVAQPRPVILSFWHNRSFFLGHFLYGSLHRRGVKITALASHSRDGELVARMARTWRVDLVRGSASRGGREALMGLYRAVARNGSSPILIPDGPRGPRYVAKLGAVILAQLSQAPILPVSCAAQGAWTLRSWDRLMVPRPFTRVVVAVGPPQQVPRHLDDDAKERQRLRLEDTLNRLGEEAAGELKVI